MSETQRVEGSVKWFSGEKGYGFATADGVPKDVFLHVKQLRASGISGSLVYGQPIAFVLNNGPKGLFATNIVCITPTGSNGHGA